jgi:predicted MFS family arabinose efflux permease
MITNTLSLWFDKRRGMAISLALNGASFGGIVGVPLLVVVAQAWARPFDRGPPVNQLVLLGTARLVPSRTGAPCYRGPRSSGA